MLIQTSIDPPLSCREQIRDFAGEAGHDVFAVQFAVFAKLGDAAIFAVNVDDLIHRIDNPNERDADGQIFFDLLIQLRDFVVRRNDFDRQVRRDGQEALA